MINIGVSWTYRRAQTNPTDFLFEYLNEIQNMAYILRDHKVKV